MLVEEDGVETQADEGDAAGKDQRGWADEGEQVLQQAVADLPPVDVGLAEDEGPSQGEDSLCWPSALGRAGGGGVPLGK